MRDLQLVLLRDGGAELVDVETDDTVWASDSDPDFAEEFPEILDENDLEHILDYLEDHHHMSYRETETCETIAEPLGPDDDGDDDEDDEDDDECWDEDDDDAELIEGEVIEGRIAR